jgi:hypothetical protein
MKKQIAIASAILAASSYSFAEIALTESLSVEGFVDMSYTDRDGTGINHVPVTNEETADSAIGIDQVEFDFKFNAGGPVTAQVDIEYEGGTTNGTGVEQAFVTYDLGNDSALTFGRFDAQLGFEAFEPTGLYQFSNAISTRNLPGQDNGVKYTRGNWGVALVDTVEDPNEIVGIGDGNSYTIELAYSQELGEGLNGFIGARLTEADTSSEVYNAYVTYETGAWLLAVEAVLSDNGTDKVTDYQIVANYTYSDTASVTARFAEMEDTGNTPNGASAVTLAHNLALADNLALIAEIKEISPNNDSDDYLESAVELLFTF